MQAGVVTDLAIMELSDLWNINQRGITNSRHTSEGQLVWKLPNI